MKPLGLMAISLGSCLGLYLVFHYLRYFSDMTFLGGFLLLEVIIMSLWKYDQRFFMLLVIVFLWAGMHVPMQFAWTTPRWIILSAGATVGFVIWTRTPRRPFGPIHLIAFFCIGAAFVSATVSSFVQMATLKALSLLLLFLYCSTGGRLAVIRHENSFFRGLLLAAEITVYITAFCYFGLGAAIWGNPNSIGAAMSVGVFPVLLWGWLIADGSGIRLRRLVALFLCSYLCLFSAARAGMAAIVIVTLTLSFCLRQYRLLFNAVAITLLLVALTGVLAPENLNQHLVNFRDTVLYKGHKDEGILGSRRTPWDTTVASIKEHPLFGTGYGTSPTGEDPGTDFGVVRSSAETSREHGSSYMMIAEWVGLLGVLPFVALLVLTVANVWRVCVWMRRTGNPRHYSVPVAMIVLAGLLHAGFEDWLLAVGYYLSVYFWFFAFLLADLLPQTEESSLGKPVRRISSLTRAGFDPAISNPAVSNR